MNVNVSYWLVVSLWILILVVPGWRIASKAGYSGALSLLLLVPVLNLILVWVFAFSKWPNQRENA